MVIEKPQANYCFFNPRMRNGFDQLWSSLYPTQSTKHAGPCLFSSNHCAALDRQHKDK
jgi:hypothetical protein